MVFFPNSMKNLAEVNLGDTVNIIMRTKDRPVLLVRALASVLAQEHQNWHLYIINDGGDKKHLEDIIKPYTAAFDGRLTLIHHAVNQGMEAASNSALKKADGDFIIIHDDDDSWHPLFLKETVAFLKKPENKQYSGVITNCEVIIESIVDDRVIEEDRREWGFFQENIKYIDVLNSNAAPPITFLIRKDVADEVGLFNEDLPVLGDWDYILRVLQVGDIGTIDKQLAYYHHRTNNNIDASYSNTVTSGDDRHKRYNALYTNASIRECITKSPHLFGLFRTIVAESTVVKNEVIKLHFKLDCITNELIALKTNLGKVKKKKNVFVRIKKELARWKRKWTA